MSVSQSAIDSVLTPLGDTEAVNIVAIFGAARGGKSFLMNQLAGQDEIFKISNDKVCSCRVLSSPGGRQATRTCL